MPELNWEQMRCLNPWIRRECAQMRLRGGFWEAKWFLPRESFSLDCTYHSNFLLVSQKADHQSSVWMMKCSLMVFYGRLVADRRRYRWALQVLWLLLVASFAAIIVALLAPCYPLHLACTPPHFQSQVSPLEALAANFVCAQQGKLSHLRRRTARASRRTFTQCPRSTSRPTSSCSSSRCR
jgi:hypothetical protein